MAYTSSEPRGCAPHRCCPCGRRASESFSLLGGCPGMHQWLPTRHCAASFLFIRAVSALCFPRATRGRPYVHHLLLPSPRPGLSEEGGWENFFLGSSLQAKLEPKDSFPGGWAALHLTRFITNDNPQLNAGSAAVHGPSGVHDTQSIDVKGKLGWATS